ncbi:hypothetical protein GRF29_28g328558 [Pseudopithomyces chartarum]|uniref:Uncharacterized protein n=1 Tax=Pseudopithomyces chartarum TaxID=1892770 RepID=A0AAN6RKG9_9PLEO|nr:hypothetical protein GRF29_28g328558 [Pseudopithomyces chartarum]
MLLNFLLLLTFLLTTPTLACKCFHQPDHSTGWDLRNTVGCCRLTKGTLNAENDCMATSLEPTMASFSKCCKSQGKVSDCGCPKGCADEEKEDEHVVVE